MKTVEELNRPALSAYPLLTGQILNTSKHLHFRVKFSDDLTERDGKEPL